jgi:hypothetical protein
VDRAGPVEQSIGKRGLAVIDMRDDAKVSGQLDRHKAQHYAGVRRVGQLSAASALLSFLPVILLMILSFRTARQKDQEQGHEHKQEEDEKHCPA